VTIGDSVTYNVLLPTTHSRGLWHHQRTQAVLITPNILVRFASRRSSPSPSNYYPITACFVLALSIHPALPASYYAVLTHLRKTHPLHPSPLFIRRQPLSLIPPSQNGSRKLSYLIEGECVVFSVTAERDWDVGELKEEIKRKRELDTLKC
jgi:hypothetical protein